MIKNFRETYTVITCDEDLEKYCLIASIYIPDIKEDEPTDFLGTLKNLTFILSISEHNLWDYDIFNKNDTDSLSEYIYKLEKLGYKELTMETLLDF